MSETVSAVEIVFVVGGLIALTANALLWRGARKDNRYLFEASRNGLMRMAARGNIARERGRVLRQTMLLGIGAVALTQPNPSGVYADSLARRAIIAGFLLFQWSLVASALQERRLRKRMIAYDERRDRRESDRTP